MTAPEPLSPPDCDLRGFDDMPLDVVMLRDSGAVRKLSAEAFRAAVLLWAAAWHQVPAGSLPNDDAELSGLAGYGFQVEAFLAVKAAALHKFALCTDGRLYHPVICEKAIKAFAKRKSLSKRASAGAAARWAENAKGKPQAKKPMPQASENDACAGQNDAKGEGEGKGDSSNEESLFGEVGKPDRVQAAFDEYNRAASEAGWKTASKLTKKRRGHINARLKAEGGLKGWDAQLERAAKIPWLAGDGKGGWIMDLDYFASERGWLKISEHREGAPHERPLNGAGNGRYQNAADRRQSAADARLNAWNRVIGEGGEDGLDGPSGAEELAGGSERRLAAPATAENRGDAQAGLSEADQGRGEPAAELLHAK